MLKGEGRRAKGGWGGPHLAGGERHMGKELAWAGLPAGDKGRNPKGLGVEGSRGEGPRLPAWMQGLRLLN